MSVGWLLLINGLIGIPVFYISWFIFLFICINKYGGNNVGNAIDYTIQESDTLGDHLIGDEHGALWKTFAYFCTFFLWEIELPLKYYVIWDSIPKNDRALPESTNCSDTDKTDI